MKSDFDIIIDRNGTNSVKYDFASEKGKPQGLLPMWVADMDFSAPHEVLADIQKAVSHGIFGYSEPKNDYYNAVSDWFYSRFNYQVEQRLPKIKLVEPQAMYLLWLDFSEYELTQTELDRKIENAKLWLNGGTMFGAEGAGFQRINIACPKSVLIDALEKLEKEFA